MIWRTLSFILFLFQSNANKLAKFISAIKRVHPSHYSPGRVVNINTKQASSIHSLTFAQTNVAFELHFLITLACNSNLN